MGLAMLPERNLAIGGLPRDILSKNGERIRLILLPEDLHLRLLAMYLDYQPRNCFQGLPPIRDEICAKWVENMIHDGVNIVALSGIREVVGHVAVFPVNERKCELLVVVAPAFQNQGVGTELVRAAADVADDLNFSQVWLPVDTTNSRARHVYEKCGFQYTSSRLARELDMALDLAQKPVVPSCAAPQPPPPHAMIASLGLAGHAEVAGVSAGF